jgi:hypothetical protein
MWCWGSRLPEYIVRRCWSGEQEVDFRMQRRQCSRQRERDCTSLLRYVLFFRVDGVELEREREGKKIAEPRKSLPYLYISTNLPNKSHQISRAKMKVYESFKTLQTMSGTRTNKTVYHNDKVLR